MNKIVVFTGAGMSAESGLKTFRDSGGLWEGYDVMEVASIQGWYRNPEKVLNFYNMRRKQAWKSEPNAGHLALVDLEKNYEVTIITQNVDNLHEKAGSRNVMHLHGSLFRAKSADNPHITYEIGYKDILPGDKAEDGSQLRPDIVWFGEDVPMMREAIGEVENADIFIVIGTSLVVYPAASLLYYIRNDVPVYIVDPNKPEIFLKPNYTYIQSSAVKGVPGLVLQLLTNG